MAAAGIVEVQDGFVGADLLNLDAVGGLGAGRLDRWRSLAS
jgi:hypothetical protein